MHNFVVLCEYNEFFNNLKDLKSVQGLTEQFLQLILAF